MSETVEIRMKVDKKFLDELKKRIKTTKNSEVVKQALSIYDWATHEIEENRTVVSVTDSGEGAERLVAPEFARIEKSG